MPIDADRITRILVDALVRRQGDEVDLVFRYGSLVTGSSHRYSDLDISWVPASEAVWDAITVMVDDVLVDCYPIHWSTLERMAVMGNVSCAILLHGRVVFQRTDAAGTRFAALGDRLREVQRPGERPAMLRRALERFRDTGYPHLLLMEAADAGHVLASLQHARQIRDTVLHCLMLVNQAPIDTRRRAAVLALPTLPRGLADLLDALDSARDPATIRDVTEALLATTRDMLLAEQSMTDPATGTSTTFADVFRGAYPELKGDLQHVLLACERGDVTPMGLVSVLHELMIHITQALTGVEHGPFNDVRDYEQDLAALGFPDLLSPALAGDTETLRRRVLAFDDRLRGDLTEHGVELGTYATADDLERHLAASG